MSALAKLLAIQEKGRQAQASKSRPPAMVGGPAGEVFGGSGGGLDPGFTTPGGGGVSVVYSEDEERSEEVRRILKARKDATQGQDTEEAVSLIFPSIDRLERQLDDNWCWSICGGLIGGAKGGNRFCVKTLYPGGPCHCGTGSHAQKKADLVEGFGYIPSNGDRANTMSAFLVPTIDTRGLPVAYLESLQTSLTPSQWVSFFAVLPTESEMSSGEEDHQEIAAAIITKASRGVSFAYTPAAKRPRMMELLSRSARRGTNLAAQFKHEEPAGKADSSVDELELAPSDDWTESGESGSSPPLFTPTAGQWNLLVKTIGSLSQELIDARKGISILAEESDGRMETLDDQVTDLRASVGKRPAVLSENVPGMELWMSVSSMCDTLQDVKHNVDHPIPNRFDMSTRDIADNAARDAQVARERASDLMQSKASLEVDHQPLAALVEGIVGDLYQPSGMFNHLLNSSVGGTPMHPATDHKDALAKLKSEMQLEIRESKGGGGQVGVDPEDPIISMMNATLKNVEVSLKTIKASLGGEVVRFDSETFHSAEEVEGWIIANMGKDVGFPDYFYDVISMLEALQDSSKTSDDLLGSQAGSIKAGHRGLSASRMLNSFSVTIPQVLAKKGSGTEISALTYEKWKSHDGRTGVVEIVRKAMDSWRYRTEGLLNSRFSSPARGKVLMLARTMMNDSINFWVTFVVWVDSFYNRLVNQAEKGGPGGEASLADRKEYDLTLTNIKKEAWNLVTSVMVDMFGEVNIRRSDGQAAEGLSHSPSLQCALILYSSLKAHKFMAELLERGFEKHPVMAPTFNGFLFSERASHGDVKRLELKIGELAALVKGLQGKVDKTKK
jgi:hypothetical protein